MAAESAICACAVAAQVGRTTPLKMRGDAALLGVLGYEMDLTRCTPFEKKVIRKQIEFYKNNRHLLQFGRFTRMQSPFDSNECLWMVSSPSGDEAIVGVYQLLAKPNGQCQKIPVRDLDFTKTFHLQNRRQYFNLRTFGDLVRHALPIRLRASGAIFNALANHYLMPNEIEDLRMEGDVLKHFGFVPGFACTQIRKING